MAKSIVGYWACINFSVKYMHNRMDQYWFCPNSFMPRIQTQSNFVTRLFAFSWLSSKKGLRAKNKVYILKRCRNTVLSINYHLGNVFMLFSVYFILSMAIFYLYCVCISTSCMNEFVFSNDSWCVLFVGWTNLRPCHVAK